MLSLAVREKVLDAVGLDVGRYFLHLCGKERQRVRVRLWLTINSNAGGHSYPEGIAP